MESAWHTKKRPSLGENCQADINLENYDGYERETRNTHSPEYLIKESISNNDCIQDNNITFNNSISNQNSNGKHKDTTNKTNIRIQKLFQTWSFGTVNIRSGKEKEEGAKIYAVAKEINRAGVVFCCLQEVRYRNNGNKLIQLDTGESYEFHWSGQKRRRDAGVGILIKVNPGIEINSPDVNDPRVMAINLRIHGFNARIVNGYAPTECDGSDSQKDLFYKKLNAACVKTQKHQKLITVGDFNATTSIANYMSYYDGIKILEDPECNDNGSRLKSFCKSQKLCMSSTFFDNPMINRYTWYSNDRNKTRKINDCAS